eukprot:SAG11_NODE_787_length_7169_cov_4.571146_5_plen_102_part_00
MVCGGLNRAAIAGDIGAAKPLVDWQNHTGEKNIARENTEREAHEARLIFFFKKIGVVTMTYFAPIKKFVLSISTATIYPMMTHQFDTYFLESDTITGQQQN